MIIHSLEDMNNLGKKLAETLTIQDNLLLRGDLGVGKTALARAIIRAWIRDDFAEIPSPSFTLIQNYEGSKGALLHIDLYRLGSEDELIEIGVPSIFEEALCLIEWPERLGHFAPDGALTINIIDKGDQKREVQMSKGGMPWEI